MEEVKPSSSLYKIGGEGATVLKCIEVKVYFGNFTQGAVQGIHLNT